MQSLTRQDPAGPLVLLTGAQGKVGRAALDALVRSGYRVRAVTSRADHPGDGARVEWRVRDLRDPGDLREDVRGCAAIVHLAAEQPHDGDLMAVNRDATARLARAAEDEDVQVMCFTSSISVHGSPVTPVVQEDAPLVTGDVDRPEEFRERPALRAYARSKVQAERAVRETAERVRYVVLRPTVIVDREDVLAALEMGPLHRAVAWSQRTHWVALEDVVDALVWAVREGLGGRGLGGSVEVYTVSDEASPHCYRDLFRAAGARRVTLHGVPLPAVPPAAWLAVKRLRQGGSRPGRRPFGLVAFPADRLIGAGWSPALGIRAAVGRALIGTPPVHRVQGPLEHDARSLELAVPPAVDQPRAGASEAPTTGRRANTTRP